MKDFAGKVVIVTGGASGIGFGLAQRFAREGAKVLLSDVNETAAQTAAGKIGAFAVYANVAIESDIAKLVDTALTRFDRIDVFVSNAGIAFPAGLDASLDQWRKIFDINLMAHVHAARHALPSMLKRGEGYFLNTASAGGLLVEFAALPYTVTKHGAVAFAEWLAVTYRKQGIRVSVLAPAGVRTPMTAHSPDLLENAIEVDEVVDKTFAGLRDERFLISTHSFVDQLFALKARDYDEYLRALAQQRERAELARAPPQFRDAEK